jgi:hypothetical protein
MHDPRKIAIKQQLGDIQELRTKGTAVYNSRCISYFTRAVRPAETH